jgi:cytochrome c peroxidase
MKKVSIIFSLLIFVLTAFISVSQLFVVPKGWPKPNYDFSKNPLSKEKIELGRALFYDPILSRDNSISCASCHNPYNAFANADHQLSLGVEDKTGSRNAPALVNLAWEKKFMWDGAINHLDMQSLFPITHPDEMGEQFDHVISKLKGSTIYPRLFYKAYQDSFVTGEHLLKAIAQFMLTLVSSNSKYDSVMRHQAVFSNQEKNGYQLFKKNCNTCHTEPLFTNHEFENNGLPIDKILNDFGRMNITGLAIDSLKFKVPTLRNIQYSSPYMHDGRFARMQDVLKHYTLGIQKSATLSQKLQQPIILTPNERVDIIAFLLTLTDNSFISNPNFNYPKYILYP